MAAIINPFLIGIYDMIAGTIAYIFPQDTVTDYSGMAGALNDDTI